MTDDPSRAEQQTRDRREEYELAEADDARTRALARIERARFGEVCGLKLRSVNGSPARYRSTHRFAVAGEHWNRSAARRNDQPRSTTRTARRRRPSGVKGALA